MGLAFKRKRLNSGSPPQSNDVLRGGGEKEDPAPITYRPAPCLDPKPIGAAPPETSKGGATSQVILTSDTVNAEVGHELTTQASLRQGAQSSVPPFRRPPTSDRVAEASSEKDRKRGQDKRPAPSSDPDYGYKGMTRVTPAMSSTGVHEVNLVSQFTRIGDRGGHDLGNGKSDGTQQVTHTTIFSRAREASLRVRGTSVHDTTLSCLVTSASGSEGAEEGRDGQLASPAKGFGIFEEETRIEPAFTVGVHDAALSSQLDFDGYASEDEQDGSEEEDSASATAVERVPVFEENEEVFSRVHSSAVHDATLSSLVASTSTSEADDEPRPAQHAGEPNSFEEETKVVLPLHSVAVHDAALSSQLDFDGYASEDEGDDSEEEKESASTPFVERIPVFEENEEVFSRVHSSAVHDATLSSLLASTSSSKADDETRPMRHAVEPSSFEEEPKVVPLLHSVAVHDAALSSQLGFDGLASEDERDDSEQEQDYSEEEEDPTQTTALDQVPVFEEEDKEVSSQVYSAVVHDATLSSLVASTSSSEADEQGQETRSAPHAGEPNGFEEGTRVALPLHSVAFYDAALSSQLDLHDDSEKEQDDSEEENDLTSTPALGQVSVFEGRDKRDKQVSSRVRSAAVHDATPSSRVASASESEVGKVGQVARFALSAEEFDGFREESREIPAMHGVPVHEGVYTYTACSIDQLLNFSLVSEGEVGRGAHAWTWVAEHSYVDVNHQDQNDYDGDDNPDDHDGSKQSSRVKLSPESTLVTGDGSQLVFAASGVPVPEGEGIPPSLSSSSRRMAGRTPLPAGFSSKDISSGGDKAETSGRPAPPSDVSYRSYRSNHPPLRVDELMFTGDPSDQSAAVGNLLKHSPSHDADVHPSSGSRRLRAPHVEQTGRHTGKEKVQRLIVGNTRVENYAPARLPQTEPAPVKRHTGVVAQGSPMKGIFIIDDLMQGRSPPHSITAIGYGAQAPDRRKTVSDGVRRVARREAIGGDSRSESTADPSWLPFRLHPGSSRKRDVDVRMLGEDDMEVDSSADESQEQTFSNPSMHPGGSSIDSGPHSASQTASWLPTSDVVRSFGHQVLNVVNSPAFMDLGAPPTRSVGTTNQPHESGFSLSGRTGVEPPWRATSASVEAHEKQGARNPSPFNSGGVSASWGGPTGANPIGANSHYPPRVSVPARLWHSPHLDAQQNLPGEPSSPRWREARRFSSDSSSFQSNLDDDSESDGDTEYMSDGRESDASLTANLSALVLGPTEVSPSAGSGLFPDTRESTPRNLGTVPSTRSLSSLPSAAGQSSLVEGTGPVTSMEATAVGYDLDQRSSHSRDAHRRQDPPTVRPATGDPSSVRSRPSSNTASPAITSKQPSPVDSNRSATSSHDSPQWALDGHATGLSTKDDLSKLPTVTHPPSSVRVSPSVTPQGSVPTGFSPSSLSMKYASPDNVATPTTSASTRLRRDLQDILKRRLHEQLSKRTDGEPNSAGASFGGLPKSNQGRLRPWVAMIQTALSVQLDNSIDSPTTLSPESSPFSTLNASEPAAPLPIRPLSSETSPAPSLYPSPVRDDESQIPDVGVSAANGGVDSSPRSSSACPKSVDGEEEEAEAEGRRQHGENGFKENAQSYYDRGAFEDHHPQTVGTPDNERQQERETDTKEDRNEEYGRKDGRNEDRSDEDESDESRSDECDKQEGKQWSNEGDTTDEEDEEDEQDEQDDPDAADGTGDDAPKEGDELGGVKREGGAR
ncbi:hypothetical protein NMY22_g11310 [Coprinellus aureogranulatus]|nr:hypothetical protein NMY22_g11310 [Coprinellus aureogranulatus]